MTDLAQPTGRGRLLLAAALAGAGTMAVELAAVRLIAPWFGTSQTVWTQVIAVILAGLAIGYLIGGRLSRRAGSARRMAWLLAVAALWTALLPVLVEPVSRWFVPEGLTLGDAIGVLRWGSLATASLLFGVPSILFGTIAPQVVEALVQTKLDAGRAGGFVLALGTLGSLVGVWGTSEVLIPTCGLAWTFRVAALSLAGGAMLLALGERDLRTTAASILIVPITLWSAPPAHQPPAGWTVLAEGQSAYQNVRVVQAPDELGGFRQLQVNEAYDSYQSVWYPEPGWLPDGYYYNDIALPFFWSGEPKTWRVLILGLGGGTAVRVLEGVLGDATALEVYGVELDPLVVEFAREHLELRLPEERLLAGRDARRGVAELPGPWDLVYLDCYANQIEIPPHLATTEFFGEIRAKLAPGGWLVANVGGFDADDPIVCAMGATVASAFDGESAVLRVPNARNWTLLARNGDELPIDAVGDRVTNVPRALQGVLGLRELSGMARRFDTSAGQVLRDLFAPTEELQRASLAYARARKGLDG